MMIVPRRYKRRNPLPSTQIPTDTITSLLDDKAIAVASLIPTEVVRSILVIGGISLATLYKDDSKQDERIQSIAKDNTYWKDMCLTLIEPELPQNRSTSAIRWRSHHTWILNVFICKKYNSQNARPDTLVRLNDFDIIYDVMCLRGFDLQLWNDLMVACIKQGNVSLLDDLAVEITDGDDEYSGDFRIHSRINMLDIFALSYDMAKYIFKCKFIMARGKYLFDSHIFSNEVDRFESLDHYKLLMRMYSYIYRSSDIARFFHKSLSSSMYSSLSADKHRDEVKLAKFKPYIDYTLYLSDFDPKLLCTNLSIVYPDVCSKLIGKINSVKMMSALIGYLDFIQSMGLAPDPSIISSFTFACIDVDRETTSADIYTKLFYGIHLILPNVERMRSTLFPEMGASAKTAPETGIAFYLYQLLEIYGINVTPHMLSYLRTIHAKDRRTTEIIYAMILKSKDGDMLCDDCIEDISKLDNSHTPYCVDFFEFASVDVVQFFQDHICEIIRFNAGSLFSYLYSCYSMVEGDNLVSLLSNCMCLDDIDLFSCPLPVISVLCTPPYKDVLSRLQISALSTDTHNVFDLDLQYTDHMSIYNSCNLQKRRRYEYKIARDIDTWNHPDNITQEEMERVMDNIKSILKHTILNSTNETRVNSIIASCIALRSSDKELMRELMLLTPISRSILINHIHINEEEMFNGELYSFIASMLTEDEKTSLEKILTEKGMIDEMRAEDNLL